MMIIAGSYSSGFFLVKKSFDKERQIRIFSRSDCFHSINTYYHLMELKELLKTTPKYIKILAEQ